MIHKALHLNDDTNGFYVSRKEEERSACTEVCEDSTIDGLEKYRKRAMTFVATYSNINRNNI